MISISIHFPEDNIISFFLWLSNIAWFIYSTFSLSFYLLIEARVHKLAIITNTALHMGIQMYLLYADLIPLGTHILVV
jgi:hypothetical protein